MKLLIALLVGCVLWYIVSWLALNALRPPAATIVDVVRQSQRVRKHALFLTIVFAVGFLLTTGAMSWLD